jgi:hypothetical protein
MPLLGAAPFGLRPRLRRLHPVILPVCDDVFGALVRAQPLKRFVCVTCPARDEILFEARVVFDSASLPEGREFYRDAGESDGEPSDPPSDFGSSTAVDLVASAMIFIDAFMSPSQAICTK